MATPGSDGQSPGTHAGPEEAAARLRHPRASDFTILLVEDLEEHRYLFATVLRLAGYRVLEAPDGERALALVRDRHPDLMVLDMGLPVLDGWQVLQLLKANPATRGMPVVVVTVHAFEHDRARAMELGCALHLAKPTRPHDLLIAVHQVLGLLPEQSGTEA